MNQVAQDIEMEIDQKGTDSEKSEGDEDEVPIFTSELAALKAKELGQEYADDLSGEEGEDQEMADDNEDNNQPKIEYPEAFSDSEEEKEDYTIRKTDSIIVAATAVSDHSNLEVYIYEHEKSNLYVHHEIILGSYPLCIEWLPSFQGQKSNLIVVGTFLPEIEIWNLDSENCEPICVLGDLETSE